MVDVAALGALLASALPYLIRAGDHVASEASRVLGDEAWRHAKRLWERLAGAVGGKPAAQEAADDVAAAPADAEAQVALVHQLRKLLEADPALAAEVERLLADAERAGVVARASSVAVGGSATNSVIITGDSARVDRA